MNSVIRAVICAGSLLLISACGGGGGSGGSDGSGSTSTSTSNPTPTVSNIVSGVASKGPLKGANVCAYAVTGGVQGAAIGTCATTDASGNYSINLGSYTGPVLFVATGGTYTDEASGVVASLPSPLHSMQANLTGNATVAITAITEIAYQNANGGTGGLTAANIQTAVANVQSNFGIADILNTLPVDALNVPANTPAAQLNYALALATISQFQSGQANGTTLNSVLQQIATCIATPNVGCSSGTTTVGALLAAAMNAFQATHASLAGAALPVGNLGALTAPTLKSGLSINPSSLTFAQQIPGTVSLPQTVTITNNSSQTVTGFSVVKYLSNHFPGNFGNDFVQSDNCPTSSLAAGASCTITVSFAPLGYSRNGNASTRSQIATVQSLDVTGPVDTTNIGLYGSVPAVPRPYISALPTSLSFQSPLGQTSASQSFTVTNTGNAPLVVTCISTGNACPGDPVNTSNLNPHLDFVATNTCKSDQGLSYPPIEDSTSLIIGSPILTLAVGSRCTINVVFNPSTTGAKSQPLAIYSNASNGQPVSTSNNVNGQLGTVFKAQLSGNSTGTPGVTVTSFSPNSGPVGTSVTITGMNFDTVSGHTKVSLQGLDSPITSITSTSITFTVPSNAHSGWIQVTDSSGNIVNFSGYQFTVTTNGSGNGSVASFAGTYNLNSSSGLSATFTLNSSGNVTGCTSSMLVVCSGTVSSNGTFTINGNDGLSPIDTTATLNGTIDAKGNVTGTYSGNSVSDGPFSGIFTGMRGSTNGLTCNTPVGSYQSISQSQFTQIAASCPNQNFTWGSDASTTTIGGAVANIGSYLGSVKSAQTQAGSNAATGSFCYQITTASPISALDVGDWLCMIGIK